MPAQQAAVTGGVQVRGDSRTDRAGSDKCNSRANRMVFARALVMVFARALVMVFARALVMVFARALIHDRQATGATATSTLGSRLVRPSTGSFCAAHSCRRFVADHRCRAHGDA